MDGNRPDGTQIDQRGTVPSEVVIWSANCSRFLIFPWCHDVTSLTAHPRSRYHTEEKSKETTAVNDGKGL